jgi:hypothetical protein
MSVVSAQGIAEPFDADGVPYASFGNQIPALRGFRLTYPAGRDRELVLLQVLAGGRAQDLTPNAQTQPTSIPDGRLQVILQDDDPSGEEFAYNVSHSLLSIPGARRYQIRDVGCAGACSKELPTEILGGGSPLDGGQPSPRLIALVGFKLFFTGNRAHELDRVGVWFRDKTLHVALRDESVGLADTFGYLVDFVVIPTFGFSASTGIKQGTAKALETVNLPTPSHAHFMLTGWAFNFRPGDREILDIGVLRGKDTFTVFYGDNGGGEEFDWRVEFAHVGPTLVSPS